MRCLSLLAGLLLPFASAIAQQTSPREGAKVLWIAPDAITWSPASAMLPAGAKVAVLEGDPSKPGPFIMRISMPDGYRVPPHLHPADEHATVLSGELRMGMGDTFDAAKLTRLPSGSYSFMPAGMHHFAQMKGVTVLQLNGVGPWKLVYVNPADQPKTTN